MVDSDLRSLRLRSGLAARARDPKGSCRRYQFFRKNWVETRLIFRSGLSGRWTGTGARYITWRVRRPALVVRLALGRGDDLLDRVRFFLLRANALPLHDGERFRAVVVQILGCLGVVETSFAAFLRGRLRG